MQSFRDRHREDLSVVFQFLIAVFVIGLLFAAIKIKLLGYIVIGLILTFFVLIVGFILYAVSVEPIVNIFKREKNFKHSLKNKKDE